MGGEVKKKKKKQKYQPLGTFVFNKVCKQELASSPCGYLDVRKFIGEEEHLLIKSRFGW